MRVLPHGGAQRGQPDGHNGGRGGEDDGELSLVLQPFYSCHVIQMVGRGEEGEGEGLTLAQFMGSYYR